MKPQERREANIDWSVVFYLAFFTSLAAALVWFWMHPL